MEALNKSWMDLFRASYIFLNRQLTDSQHGRMIWQAISAKQIVEGLHLAAGRVHVGERVMVQSLRLSFARYLLERKTPFDGDAALLGQARSFAMDLFEMIAIETSPLDELWAANEGPWR